MAAWLNIFEYIGFVEPLRITIAFIAIIVGLINCKELFFFRRGITLTIQDRHKGMLYRMARKIKTIMTDGSTILLIGSSATLAIFASLIELPCTAGFPIIYTGILTGKYLNNSFQYYAYLAFYDIVYVLPLLVIVNIFGFFLKSKQITTKQVQIIKFIGGIIMILLGVILLFKPTLIIGI